jgi:hypothetical protein
MATAAGAHHKTKKTQHTWFIELQMYAREFNCLLVPPHKMTRIQVE